jgi:3-hydroxyisobutyrate dehydrogenase/putative dehydrogenase
MRVGWLGLGAMGGPMAGCLARAGHAVVATTSCRGGPGADRGRGAGRRASPGPSGTRSSWRSWSPPRIRWTRSSSGQAARLSLAPGRRDDHGYGGAPRSSRKSPRVGLAGSPWSTPWSGGVQPPRAICSTRCPGRTTRSAGPGRRSTRWPPPPWSARPGDGQRMKLVNQLLCGVHRGAGEALAFAESLAWTSGVLAGAGTGRGVVHVRGPGAGWSAGVGAAPPALTFREGHGPGRAGRRRAAAPLTR